MFTVNRHLHDLYLSFPSLQYGLGQTWTRHRYSKTAIIRSPPDYWKCPSGGSNFVLYLSTEVFKLMLNTQALSKLLFLGEIPEGLHLRWYLNKQTTTTKQLAWSCLHNSQLRWSPPVTIAPAQTQGTSPHTLCQLLSSVSLMAMSSWAPQVGPAAILWPWPLVKLQSDNHQISPMPLSVT